MKKTSLICLLGMAALSGCTLPDKVENRRWTVSCNHGAHEETIENNRWDSTPWMTRQPRGAAFFLLADDGSFAYVPRRNYAGTDAFSFAYKDMQGKTVEIRNTVEVRKADPHIRPLAFRTDQKTPIFVPQARGLLGAGVSCADFPEDLRVAAALRYSTDSLHWEDLHCEVRGVTDVALGNAGLLKLSPSGAFAFVPDGAFTGTVDLAYAVTDGIRRVEAGQANGLKIQVLGADPKDATPRKAVREPRPPVTAATLLPEDLSWKTDRALEYPAFAGRPLVVMPEAGLLRGLQGENALADLQVKVDRKPEGGTLETFGHHASGAFIYTPVDGRATDEFTFHVEDATAGKRSPSMTATLRMAQPMDTADFLRLAAQSLEKKVDGSFYSFLQFAGERELRPLLAEAQKKFAAAGKKLEGALARDRQSILSDCRLSVSEIKMVDQPKGSEKEADSLRKIALLEQRRDQEVKALEEAFTKKKAELDARHASAIADMRKTHAPVHAMMDGLPVCAQTIVPMESARVEAGQAELNRFLGELPAHFDATTREDALKSLRAYKLRIAKQNIVVLKALTTALRGTPRDRHDCVVAYAKAVQGSVNEQLQALDLMATALEKDPEAFARQAARAVALHEEAELNAVRRQEKALSASRKTYREAMTAASMRLKRSEDTLWDAYQDKRAAQEPSEADLRSKLVALHDRQLEIDAKSWRELQEAMEAYRGAEQRNQIALAEANQAAHNASNIPVAEFKRAFSKRAPGAEFAWKTLDVHDPANKPFMDARVAYLKRGVHNWIEFLKAQADADCQRKNAFAKSTIDADVKTKNAALDSEFYFKLPRVRATGAAIREAQKADAEATTEFETVSEEAGAAYAGAAGEARDTYFNDLRRAGETITDASVRLIYGALLIKDNVQAFGAAARFNFWIFPKVAPPAAPTVFPVGDKARNGDGK